MGEGIDDIIGLVYAKDLMRAERDGQGDRGVAELMRPVKFVPETKRVAELLPRDAGRAGPPGRSWSTSTAAPPGW